MWPKILLMEEVNDVELYLIIFVIIFEASVYEIKLLLNTVMFV